MATHAFTCDEAANCTLVRVAKADPDKKTRNTKVLFRRIRIRVLDCRSGQPIVGVPVQEIRIDDQPLVRFSWSDSTWDISKHFPLFRQDGYWYHGTARVPGSAAELKGMGAAAQHALAALGYSKNLKPFSDQFGANGRKRMWEYLRDRGVRTEDLPPYDPKPAERWQPEQAWLQAVIREYNSRCYRMAGLCLAARGFFPNSGDPLAEATGDDEQDFIDDRGIDRWSEDWIKAFHTWQKTQYNVKNPWDWVKTQKWGKLLMDEKSPYVTNQNGDVYVPVPLTKLKAGLTIEVGFKEFAVVAEATKKQLEEESKGTICRTYFIDGDDGRTVLEEANQPTEFSVEWVDRDQESGRNKPWGWRLGPSPSKDDAERATFAEFRTSWKFEVPKAPEIDRKSKLSYFQQMHEKHSCFSCFYGPNEPEFVLFALVWCQPVWDDQPDAAPGLDPQINENAYIHANDASLHMSSSRMHVVTLVRDLNGSEEYGGKGLGIFEYRVNTNTKWRGDEGHRGYDLHGIDGESKVFAVHGGYARRYAAAAQPAAGWKKGNNVTVTWQGQRGIVQYLHLSSFSVADKTNVLAGQVLGRMGRTGNLGAESQWPTHVHLNVGGDADDEASWNKLRNEPDDDNKVCLPHQLTPLRFPCRCEVTQAAWNPANCRFGDGLHGTGEKFVDICWAVADLCCPEMPKKIVASDLGGGGDKAKNRRMQAQLRYLHERVDSDEYHDPGTLDGQPGGVPPAADPAPTNTREAVYKVKLHNDLLPKDREPTLDEKYGIDKPFVDKLNELAPVLSKPD